MTKHLSIAYTILKDTNQKPGLHRDKTFLGKLTAILLTLRKAASLKACLLPWLGTRWKLLYLRFVTY